jgi:hypothetical protein
MARTASPTDQPADKRTNGKDAWKNRIVGEGFERPDQLLRNPFNARIHPKFQQDALEGVLSEVGWVQKVLVNRRTGHVVDGHARIEVAISRGEPQVPVTYLDLTEDEEKKVLLSLDPISAMAVTDARMQDDLLKSVTTDEAGLQAMLDKMRHDTDVMLELESNIFNNPVKPTETLAGKDGEIGQTPEQKADLYNTTSIRQIMFFFDSTVFEELIPRLTTLRERYDVKDNSALLLALVDTAEETFNVPAEN